MRGNSHSAKSVRPVRIESLEQRVLMSGGNYFVAPWGNDGGNGSAAQPWQTVQHAVDATPAGGTINLRAGDYAGGVRIEQPNITLRSAPGETASISAPNDDENLIAAVTFGADATGGRLMNLDVSGGGYYTVKTDSTWDTGAPGEHGASNLLLFGNKLHDSGRDVVKLTPGSDNIRIIGNEIYNSGRRDPSNAEGIDAVNADNLLIQGNYVHDITTNGMYSKGGGIHTVIRRNRVENVGNSGIILGQESDNECFDNNANPDQYESIDGVVRANVVVNAQGAGIAAWAALRPQISDNSLMDVAQSMMGGILINGQTHWHPDEVMTPSQDVTVTGNVVRVFSDRPVVDIREGGLNGGLAMSGNSYDQGSGRTPQFWDERSGFQGGLRAWQRQLQTDSGSAVAA